MISDPRVMVAAAIGWWVLLGIIVYAGPRAYAFHRRGIARVRADKRRRRLAETAATHRALNLTNDEAERLWQYVIDTNGVTRVPAPRNPR